MKTNKMTPLPFATLMASLPKASTARIARGQISQNAATFGPSAIGNSTPIEKGNRNNTIAQYAGRCIRRGCTLEETTELALVANRRCNPPLPESEVRQICRNIEKTHLTRNAKAPTLLYEEELTPLFSVSEYKASRFFDKEPEPRRWIVVGVIPLGISATLVAPGGLGKTMCALQIAVTVASGEPFAGAWGAGETGPVMMLLAEDDEKELHRRVANTVRQLAMEGKTGAVEQLAENLIIKSVIGEPNLLTSTNPGSHEVEFTIRLEQLILTAKQVPNLKLLVIDPASRYRGGNENAAQDTTRFVEAIEKIVQQTGATVLIIHHANKGSFTATEASQSASRGSSALTDGVRLQMNLSGFDEKTAKKYLIPAEQRKQYLTLAVTKTNYSPPIDDIVLQRGPGGYLSTAKLKCLKEVKRNDLTERVVKLVKDEREAGRSYSKSAFADKFGGSQRDLGVGNNTLRDALGVLLEHGTLTLDSHKKLCMPPRKR